MLDQRMVRIFDAICAAAREGRRCPSNIELGPSSCRTVQALAHEGRLRVEVHARNWRTVTILAGPDAGKHTARPPGDWEVYRVIDQNGSAWPTQAGGAPPQTAVPRINRRVPEPARGSMQAPAKTKALGAARFYKSDFVPT